MRGVIGRGRRPPCDHHSRLGALETKGASGWWSAADAVRVPLVIRGPVPQGATLVVVLDRASLVAQGRSLVSNNDVRLAIQDGANNVVEVDRRAPEWGGSSVELEFRVQSAIENGETNTRSWLPGVAARVQNDSVANTTAWWFEMSSDNGSATLRPQLNNVDGGWSYGGELPYPFGTSRWHHFRVAVVGRTFDARMDGFRYLQHTRVKDTDHVASGTVSLGGHTAGHNSLWDNVKVTRFFAGERIQSLGALQDRR